MVGGALAADADVFARLAAGLDGLMDHGLHCRVALVEGVRHEAGIPVQT